LQLTLGDLGPELLEAVRNNTSVVLVIDTHNEHAMPELRRLFFTLLQQQISNPVIISRKFSLLTDDTFQLFAATDVGGLLIEDWVMALC
jgi:(E)-4-hydroxy-3-methylbut-2-enyl-diphosphate synthase